MHEKNDNVLRHRRACVGQPLCYPPERIKGKWLHISTLSSIIIAVRLSDNIVAGGERRESYGRSRLKTSVDAYVNTEIAYTWTKSLRSRILNTRIFPIRVHVLFTDVFLGGSVLQCEYNRAMSALPYRVFQMNRLLFTIICNYFVIKIKMYDNSK